MYVQISFLTLCNLVNVGNINTVLGTACNIFVDLIGGTLKPAQLP